MERLFSSRTSEVQNIQGLEEFLYIPTAVDDDDDELESESLCGDIIDQKEDEGNSLSTDLSDITQSPTRDKPSLGKVMIENSQDTHERDSSGSELSGHGTRKKKKLGGGGTSPGKIDSRYTNNKEGVEGIFLSEVPVTYRSFAQVESGKVIHNIVVHSDYEFENGRIDLVVGGDQSEDVVTIKSCSMPGTIQDNTISGLHIVKGKNILRIQFADNMKHAVKLDAYELK